MPTVPINLTYPDQRICSICKGAGYFYQEVPIRPGNPAGAILKECPRKETHVYTIFVEVASTPTPKPAPAGIDWRGTEQGKLEY